LIIILFEPGTKIVDAEGNSKEEKVNFEKVFREQTQNQHDVDIDDYVDGDDEEEMIDA